MITVTNDIGKIDGAAAATYIVVLTIFLLSLFLIVGA